MILICSVFLYRYPFRQNTDFLYLTGFQQPDAVLVLRKYHQTLCYNLLR